MLMQRHYFRILIAIIAIICLIILVKRNKFFDDNDDNITYMTSDISYFALSADEYAADETFLKNLAQKYGTDKGPVGHNYTRHYSKFFAPLRQKPIKFLEIGIFKGNSVKMWEEYFPVADLHFMDYSEEFFVYRSNRSKYHIIDQMNRAQVEKFGQKYGPFDVIIDDASHRTPETIAAFEALLKFVKPGGLYFIEDIHLLYLSEWGGGGTKEKPALSPNSFIHYMYNRVDDVQHWGASTGWASYFEMTKAIHAKLNDYSKRIESIQFFTGICAVKIRSDVGMQEQIIQQ